MKYNIVSDSTFKNTPAFLKWSKHFLKTFFFIKMAYRSAWPQDKMRRSRSQTKYSQIGTVSESLPSGPETCSPDLQTKHNIMWINKAMLIFYNSFFAIYNSKIHLWLSHEKVNESYLRGIYVCFCVSMNNSPIACSFFLQRSYSKSQLKNSQW